MNVRPWALDLKTNPVFTNPTLATHKHTQTCPTALRLGGLVSGLLSSKSRSSQMSDSRQTPTSSVQSKSSMLMEVTLSPTVCHNWITLHEHVESVVFQSTFHVLAVFHGRLPVPVQYFLRLLISCVLCKDVLWTSNRPTNILIPQLLS